MKVRDDSPARPLLLLGLTGAFITFLLLVSGGGDAKFSAQPKAPGRLPGAIPRIPGAPIDGIVNRPVPSAPPTTIIDDVRETLHRLPLDRNTPPGAGPARKPG
jgi:hypothetical protein